MVVSSKDSAKVVKDFGDKVRHVSGNLFMVDRESVRMAKSGLSSVNGSLVYGNPRWYLGDDGKPEAKGLDKSKMEELKDSIREDGMDHPIRLRVVSEGGSNSLEIVNGERRFRAICELVKEGAKCFDPSSGDTIPAKDMYEWVECRVEYMDDDTALRSAFRLNETGEVIGETANMAMVKVLRESGYDNQEILKVTGKSLSWLRETDRIIGLDEVCLEHLKSDSINRRVALRLAMIQDVEERVALLEKIKASAESRHAEKVRQSKAKAEEAKSEAMDSVVEAFEAEINGGDQEEKEKAAKRAAKKAERAEAKLREVEGSKPKAGSKDMQSAEGTNKPLSLNKIASLYLDPLSELIDNDGGHEDGNFNMAQLVLVHAILKAIMSGNRDMWSVLKENCSIEDEEENSYMEASDEEEEEDEDENSYVEASDEDEEEEEDEDENSYVEASDEEEEEEEDEDENSYVEASDEEEEEEEDEDENSYVEASDEEEDSYEADDDDDDDDDIDDSYDDDEMTSELEREFQEELRAIDRM